MEEEYAFHCRECGGYAAATSGGGVPECCGQPMERLPVTECLKDPAFAEHARMNDDDAPCDDRG